MSTDSYIQPLNPSDPATVFISYARGDEAAVLPLERALQERGVRVLRDKPSLTLGAHNQTLTRMIDVSCDAILFYMTDKLMHSDFIWRYEIPAAIARHKREPNFHLIPVLLGIDYKELALMCSEHRLPSLSDFNAEHTDETILTPAEIFRIARRTLRSALVLRLLRGSADENISLCVRTFEYTPPSPVLHLDLDWMAAFSGNGSTPEIWSADLLPALADVTDALAHEAGGRVVDAWLKARLPVGIAFGYAMPPKGSLRLRLRNEDTTWACFGQSGTGNGLPVLPERKTGSTTDRRAVGLHHF